MNNVAGPIPNKSWRSVDQENFKAEYNKSRIDLVNKQKSLMAKTTICIITSLAVMCLSMAAITVAVPIISAFSLIVGSLTFVSAATLVVMALALCIISPYLASLKNSKYDNELERLEVKLRQQYEKQCSLQNQKAN